jgi:hypothetical protein
MLVPPLKAAKLLERQVTKQIRDYMKARGWRPIRMQRTVMPGQFQTGEPGIPDYLFVRYLRPGIATALWIELKRPGGGKLRPQQREWISRELQRGALVWIVDDFDEFCAAYSGTFGWLHGKNFSNLLGTAMRDADEFVERCIEDGTIEPRMSGVLKKKKKEARL